MDNQTPTPEFQPTISTPPAPVQPAPVKPKSKLPLILFTVMVLAIVGFGIYYLKNNSGSKKSINQSKQLVPTISVRPIVSTPISNKISDTNSIILSKQTLTSLQKDLNLSAPVLEQKNVDWLDQAKNRVPLKGQDFGAGTFANDYMGKYGNFNNIDDVTETSLKPLVPPIDIYFITNGFQKDNQNTFSKAVGEQFIQNLGYTKGDIKCLVIFNSYIDPFGNFFCGIIDQEQNIWRNEVASAIDTQNDPEVVVTVNKLSGNYATGLVGAETRTVWYAVKVDGKWKEVWRGQNIISCKPVQQYNIPKDIYDPKGVTGCTNNY